MNQKSIVIYKTWQINIPEDFITQLGIREGNTLSCFLEDNEIRLRPEKPDKAPIKYTTTSAASLPHASVSKHPMYQKEFHIQCFGSMSVSRNGETMIFQNKKAKELIAYLLCNGGGPIKNAVLAEVLWPDTPFTNAMDNLYKVNRYLRNLRMGEESFPIIMTHGEIYIDCGRLSCDLHKFEELYQQKEQAEAWIEAVELYRGSVLYGEYYDWIAPYESYYDIRFLEMTEYLITYFEQTGNRGTADYYRLKQDR